MKELERKTVLEGVLHKKLTLKEASKRLSLSYRHIKRVWKRYQNEQDRGLQHKSRGRIPSNAYPGVFKDRILGLYQDKYLDFGPTFAAEKLLEDDGHSVCSETLRLWLKRAGLWHRKRKHKVYRARRERRASFGELLQIDGSIHAWFEGGQQKSCLLNMVDDATGMTLALLDTGETTQILLTTFQRWVETYGIPKSVYVDLKSVYVSPKQLKEKYDDDLLIKSEFSVFEQVCKKLKVEIIRAYSPQAKGRVERKHAVFQDRLVKDLKLYGIKTIEDANEYLITKFLNKINNKFARNPDEIPNVHRNPCVYGDLKSIFCWSYQRQLKNDWTIQFKRDYYQVREEAREFLQPKMLISVKKYLDGGMGLWYEDKEIKYYQLLKKPEPLLEKKKDSKGKRGADTFLISKRSRANKHKTPWGQFRPNWLNSTKKTNGKKSFEIPELTEGVW